MTSKKRYSAFRLSFLWGITFISIVALLLLLMIGAIVKNYIPTKNHSKQVNTLSSQENDDSKMLSPKKITDTIYVTKTILEKCTKNHCEQKSSPHDSLVEKFQQDSTNK